MVAGQVEGVGRYGRGGVQEDVVAVFLGRGDPVEGVPYAGEVGLCGIGEESAAAPAGREGGAQAVLVDRQLRSLDGDVLGFGAGRAGVLAQAVHGVVVVEEHHEPAAGGERIRLADQTQRGRRVRGEHHRVLGGVGGEVPEHGRAGAGEQVARGAGGGALRVRVAEDASGDPLGAGPDQRGRGESRARVVEIGVSFGVQIAEVVGPQLAEIHRVHALAPPVPSSHFHSTTKLRESTSLFPTPIAHTWATFEHRR